MYIYTNSQSLPRCHSPRLPLHLTDIYTPLQLLAAHQSGPCLKRPASCPFACFGCDATRLTLGDLIPHAEACAVTHLRLLGGAVFEHDRALERVRDDAAEASRLAEDAAERPLTELAPVKGAQYELGARQKVLEKAHEKLLKEHKALEKGHVALQGEHGHLVRQFKALQKEQVRITQRTTQKASTE